eukprot:2266203-Pyramimonas_sp.AAC.1
MSPPAPALVLLIPAILPLFRFLVPSAVSASFSMGKSLRRAFRLRAAAAATPGPRRLSLFLTS